MLQYGKKNIELPVYHKCTSILEIMLEIGEIGPQTGEGERERAISYPGQSLRNGLSTKKEIV